MQKSSESGLTLDIQRFVLFMDRCSQKIWYDIIPNNMTSGLCYSVESEGVMCLYFRVRKYEKSSGDSCKQVEKKGCPEVIVCDLAREDMAKQWKMHSVMESWFWQLQLIMQNCLPIHERLY